MATSYVEWLEAVKQTLATTRPDVNPKLLDPNETFVAFTAGQDALDFAGQMKLPLLSQEAEHTSRKPLPRKVAVRLAAILVVGALIIWFAVGYFKPPEEKAKEIAKQVMTDYCDGGIDAFEKSKWWNAETQEQEDRHPIPAHTRNPVIESSHLNAQGNGLDDKGGYYEVEGLVEALRTNGEWGTTRFWVVLDLNLKFRYFGVHTESAE